MHTLNTICCKFWKGRVKSLEEDFDICGSALLRLDLYCFALFTSKHSSVRMLVTESLQAC